MESINLKRNLPKFLLMIITIALSLILSGCKFADQLSNFFGFNPMLNYVNLNYIDIYYIQDVNGAPETKSIAYFDFVNHDKDYYKSEVIEDSSNEYEEQLSRYGIYFTDSIYKTRYLEKDDLFKKLGSYFYIDISIKNFDASNITLSYDGCDSIIVTYTDNTLEVYSNLNDSETCKLSDKK